MLIRRGGGAFLQGGGFFRLTIWGICLRNENAPPVNVPTAQGGLLDVGVADNVVLGVPCSVGIAQDAEGDIRAVVEGIRADAGNIAEVADGFQRSAVTECTRADFCHAVQTGNAHKRLAAGESAHPDCLRFRHTAYCFERTARQECMVSDARHTA